MKANIYILILLNIIFIGIIGANDYSDLRIKIEEREEEDKHLSCWKECKAYCKSKFGSENKQCLVFCPCTEPEYNLVCSHYCRHQNDDTHCFNQFNCAGQSDSTDDGNKANVFQLTMGDYKEDLAVALFYDLQEERDKRAEREAELVYEKKRYQRIINEEKRKEQYIAENLGYDDMKEKEQEAKEPELQAKRIWKEAIKRRRTIRENRHKAKLETEDIDEQPELGSVNKLWSAMEEAKRIPERKAAKIYRNLKKKRKSGTTLRARKYIKEGIDAEEIAKREEEIMKPENEAKARFELLRNKRKNTVNRGKNENSTKSNNTKCCPCNENGGGQPEANWRNPTEPGWNPEKPAPEASMPKEHLENTTAPINNTRNTTIGHNGNIEKNQNKTTKPVVFNTTTPISKTSNNTNNTNNTNSTLSKEPAKITPAKEGEGTINEGNELFYRNKVKIRGATVKEKAARKKYNQLREKRMKDTGKRYTKYTKEGLTAPEIKQKEKEVKQAELKAKTRYKQLKFARENLNKESQQKHNLVEGEKMRVGNKLRGISNGNELHSPEVNAAEEDYHRLKNEREQGVAARAAQYVKDGLTSEEIIQKEKEIKRPEREAKARYHSLKGKINYDESQTEPIYHKPKVVNTEKLGEISMEKEYRQLRADREARTTYRMTQYVEEGLTQEEIKEREKAARKPEIDAKKKYQKERMDRKEEKLRRKIARGY